MQHSESSNLAFEQIVNFRDVGISINAVSGLARLKPGLLFRSARLDAASISDRDKITRELEIKTVIDLRTTTELWDATNDFASRNRESSGNDDESTHDETNLDYKIPSLDYAEININGRGFERSLVWQLSYFSLGKVIMFMALGYRMEAVSIIAREVLQPRGLVGLAIDTVEHSQPEIRAIFERMADEKSWPVVVHCTQGKDRTGLVVLLLLLLCGIEISTITEDYVRSVEDLASIEEERTKEIISIGLDESFAKCPRELPAKIQQHICDKYGSIEAYLEIIGVTEHQMSQIQSIMVGISVVPVANPLT